MIFTKDVKLEMIEEDNRIKGLDKLKSVEEYLEAKRDFDYYISEYEWFSNSKDPISEIESELKKCSDDLRPNMEHDEELGLLSKIQTLKAKYAKVARGEYATNLKENISALLLMMEQYEATNEKRNFPNLIRGILKGDLETKEYLKKKYMLSWSNMYGITKAPESLCVETMEDILDYMAQNYNLVDIDLSDGKGEMGETALAIVYTEPGSIEKSIRSNIKKLVDDRLKVLDNEDIKDYNSKLKTETIKREKQIVHDKKEQEKGEIEI